MLSTVASPGKLWTGSTEFWGRKDYQEGGFAPTLDGAIVPVEALLVNSPKSAASTRKLKVLDTALPATAIDALKELKTLFITAGGVGSTFSRTVGFEEGSGPKLESLRVWNWSKRVGGHVIIDPLAVVSGRGIIPPPCKEGYVWIHTYRGLSLMEFVLVQLQEGEIHSRHILENNTVDRLSPPERRAEEEASIATTAEHQRQLTEGTPTNEEFLEVA